MNTLELVTLQNELLISMSDSLNAHEVIHTTLRDMQKRLGLSSIHFYTFEESKAHEQTLQSTISLPHSDVRPHNDPDVMEFLNKLACTEHVSCSPLETEHDCYLAFDLHPYGIVLMVSRVPLVQSVRDAITAVIHKLSAHYHACVQHRALKDQVKNNQAVQKDFEKQAKQDPLTNLPNRREFRYSLYQAIARTQRYNVYGALMYIDLDNFKNINDSLGHSVGDILLTQVAERLKAQARVGDSVYRIGGDEFVYILSNISNEETDAINTAQTVAMRVLETMASPVEIGEFSLHITPSIGICIFPEADSDENDSESVLKHADTAMYRAKQEGRNRYEFFDPEMQVEASKRLIIEDHLRKALNKQELHMEYQPIVDINNHIAGAESLVRWHNPVLGPIAPDHFIHIAEESNLILELSHWITREACKFAGELYRSLPADSEFNYISINISPRQFMHPKFVEQILQFIREADVPSHFIKLEFTENILAHNITHVIEKMQQLIDNKIEFLLDDFGTGYSSLSYLHRLPIKILKIDKSFVSDFRSHSADSQAIVDAILVMADTLGVKCIVEGVEKQEDVDYFTDKDVFGMQGYFFHIPMKDHSLRELLIGE